MKQKQKHGIWIHQNGEGATGKFQWMTLLIAAMFASLILIFTMADLTGWNTIYAPWAMAAAAIVICVAYGFLSKLNKMKWFYPAYLMILLLLIVILGKQILSGFCMFWNQLGDAWMIANGWVIDELSVGDAQGNEALSLFMFSIAFGSMTAAICCGLAQIEKQILTILLPVLVFGGMAMFHHEASWQYVVPCLFFSISLLLYGGKGTDDKDLQAAVSRWIPVIICSTVLLALTAMPVVQEWASDVGETVQEKMHITRYETNYTTLPEGDFSTYTASGNQNHPALVVTMEQPETLYLRGFTGAVFEGDTWKPLDGKILAEQENLLYWMNQQGWNPHGLFEKAVSLTADAEESGRQEVTVQNLNACSQYLYVPYTLCADNFLTPQQISPDGVISKGKDIYIYATVSGGAEQISQTLHRLQKDDADDAKAYLQAEKAYREFVYDHYTDIPQDIEKQMLPYWEKAVKEYGSPEEMTSAEIQECIRSFLTACFPEEDTEETAKIKLPLEQVEGSSYQQATVAAMTLRYFGIPARYAEGYVITKEMAENADNESTIQVGSGDGGAWVELYQNGLGWVPMAVMPGIEEEPLSMNLEAEDGDIPKEIPPQSLQDEKEPEEQQKQNGGSVTSIEEKLSAGLTLGIALIFLVLLLIALRRKLILKRRNRKWDESTAKDAAAWIFADTADLLRRLGFARGKGSMTDLQPGIKKKFGDTYAVKFEMMIDVNARALFSSRALTEDDRKLAKAFYADTLQLLTANAKWYKKLWMQWILCLY